MIKNDINLAKELETLNDIFSKGLQHAILQRLQKYPEGEKVLSSLARQERELTTNKLATWQAMLGVSLKLLLMDIGQWTLQTQFKPMRPKERKEAFDRIKVNSMRLLEDLIALGLPINSSKYFTQEELFDRYQEMFTMFDLPDELTEAGYVDFKKDLKSYIETFWGDHPKSDVVVTDLLLKLADAELLDTLAAPAIVSKTESENFPRVFMIRKLAQWFTRKYGKELHNLIANLCVLIFDDTSIDRDTVRSALSGFEVIAKQDWRMDYPQFIERIKF